jgi:RNA polymerase sigma-70 factor (ECF subfamily)
MLEQEESLGSTDTDWFTTTHWSVVLGAAQGDRPAAREALERLCTTYWYPLYAYVRRRGYSPEDAQDLTQGFFERVLEKHYLDQVDQSKGRFRAFLLATLKHFLSDQSDRQRAAKRGGRKSILSLDAQAGEEHYRLEPVDAISPDRLYERRWAFTVLGEARRRLRAEFAAAGRLQLYEHLDAFESGEETGLTFNEVGHQLGLSEACVKSAALRLRRRYGELLREEIAQTVASVAEIDEEIRHLVSVVSNS